MNVNKVDKQLRRTPRCQPLVSIYVYRVGNRYTYATCTNTGTHEYMCTHMHLYIWIYVCIKENKHITNCWKYPNAWDDTTFNILNAVVSIGRKIFKLQIIIYSSNLILQGIVWEQFKLYKYLFSLFSTEQGYYGYFLLQEYNNTDLFLYIIFISLKVTNQF